MSQQELDLLPEPDEPALEPEPIEALVVSAEVMAGIQAVSADIRPPSAEAGLALLSLMPDLALRALLTFLPDVRLKQDLAVLAAASLLVDVKAEGGLVQADAALGPVRDQIKAIELCFDGTEKDPGPTALAFRLHKRLTGLRADFTQQGVAAVETVNQRILDEQRRLKQAAEEQRRKDQAEADRKAREDAQRAVDEAKKAGAPKEVVKEMATAAKTVSAPPVAARSAPRLAHSTVVEKWTARIAGTPADAEPNPKTADMTEAQRKELLRIHQAIFEGRAPLLLMDVNWGFANGRADSDKKTFDIPGLEAFDAGGVRAKPRR